MFKENLQLIFLSLLIFLCFESCISKSDRDRDEAITKDCLEEKSKEEKYKSIEEALAHYDFVVARKYLSCFPNTGYKEAYKSRNFLKKDRPGGDRDQDGKNNKYKEYLTAIVKAEIAFWLKQDDFNRARSVANEADMFQEIEFALPDYVTSLIEKNQFDKVFSILLSWKFKYDFFESKEPESDYDNTIYKNNPTANTFYNQEVQTYNDIVDIVFNSALLKNDKTILKKCLSLYVPIAVANPIDNDKVLSVLRNDSKTAATKRMSDHFTSNQ
jgi:hypothetical protein